MKNVVTYSLPEDLLSKINQRAEQHDLPRSRIVAKAVNWFLQQPNGVIVEALTAEDARSPF
jgi:hypothetical protein